jgi:hypothetical protein
MTEEPKEYRNDRLGIVWKRETLEKPYYDAVVAKAANSVPPVVPPHPYPLHEELKRYARRLSKLLKKKRSVNKK